ncbi:MAG TPA: prolipoprotein diacylglyceryl transferase [Acidimicrobiales bacterium]|nr:prolipoprotein diacylglyceryl transferase [Acidimicrobiales bacterium]
MLGVISYNPIVRVHFGPLSISPHGVFIAIGFMVGAWFMLPQSRRRGMSDDIIYPLFTRAAIGALIGARVAYVINHIGSYATSPQDIFFVWQGGISLLGGFFGAILMACPRMRKERLSFWKVMDSAAPGMALGVFVGRTGDIIIGDHLGKVTSFFLGYRCPPINVATGSPCAPTALVSRTPGAIVHQTALYDQLLALVLFTILLRLRRKDRWDGFLIAVFALGYGLCRILEDFLRDDVRRFGLTGSQWSAIATVLLCIFTLTVLRRTPKWGRWDLRPVPAGVPVGEVGEPVPPTDDRPSAEARTEPGILNQEDHGPEP